MITPPVKADNASADVIAQETVQDLLNELYAGYDVPRIDVRLVYGGMRLIIDDNESPIVWCDNVSGGLYIADVENANGVRHSFRGSVEKVMLGAVYALKPVANIVTGKFAHAIAPSTPCYIAWGSESYQFVGIGTTLGAAVKNARPVGKIVTATMPFDLFMHYAPYAGLVLAGAVEAFVTCGSTAAYIERAHALNLAAFVTPLY